MEFFGSFTVFNLVLWVICFVWVSQKKYARWFAVPIVSAAVYIWISTIETGYLDPFFFITAAALIAISGLIIAALEIVKMSIRQSILNRVVENRVSLSVVLLLVFGISSIPVWNNVSQSLQKQAATDVYMQVQAEEVAFGVVRNDLFIHGDLSAETDYQRDQDRYVVKVSYEGELVARVYIDHIKLTVLDIEPMNR